jgi:hypothetical protein
MRNDNEIGWRSEPNPSGLQKSPYHLQSAIKIETGGRMRREVYRRVSESSLLKYYGLKTFRLHFS